MGRAFLIQSVRWRTKSKKKSPSGTLITGTQKQWTLSIINSYILSLLKVLMTVKASVQMLLTIEVGFALFLVVELNVSSFSSNYAQRIMKLY